MKKVDFKIKEYSMGTRIQNEIGDFFAGSFLVSYENKLLQNILLYKEITSPLNLRIQSGCLSGDIFGDKRCDCHDQLVNSMKFINQHNNGLIIYTIEHDGRGRGFTKKMKVYQTKDIHNVDSKDACGILGYEYEQRDYTPIVEILKILKIDEVNLLTKNPEKINILLEANIKILKTFEIK